MLLARRSGPPSETEGRNPTIAVIRGPRLPARCSQWIPSSKNASPPAIVSSLRQSSDVFREQFSEPDRLWFVVIVLADDHHTVRARPRLDRGQIVFQTRKCRFLDEHVLACRQRAERQV